MKPLADRLKDMTRKLYLAMNGVGYARADIRMNEATVNCSCSRSTPIMGFYTSPKTWVLPIS
jgi:hypothetical protein